ncbi:glutathione synthase [Nematocida homosporus]|uniref:glutathione synthase n=1 Tax=Nematocida homosporus TaxID=1912981 RepID=UPI00221F89F9|nr:glutathione synthase [Nematocida homosporus]KAI5184966.1 glutathione synthase [Nematocida homosporus]
MVILERALALKQKYGLKRCIDGFEEDLGVTLYPSVYRRDRIEDLFNVQLLVNRLILGIARDEKMLNELGTGELVVEGEKVAIDIESDLIYGILERIRRERVPVRKIEGLLVRSDYIESIEGSFKQVEVNTVSCAFVVAGQSVNKMHEELMGDDEWQKSFERAVGELDGREVLVSEGPERLQEFIRLIDKEYKQMYGCRGVFILLDNDSSVRSKNYLEKQQILELVGALGMKAYFVAVDDMLSRYEVVGDRLFYNGEEVSVVYFRWLYNADQYTEEIIKMRIAIESTVAVPVPSVNVQIAGLKFFQRLFAKREFLSRYTEDFSVERFFVSFMTVAEYRKHNPKKPYVLKPLSEGGGHNYFKGDVLEKVKSLTGKEEEAYILMEEIEGTQRKNRALMKPIGNMIGEVGVFGYTVATPTAEASSVAGYILRTRYHYDNEVGVSAGFGSLDSIMW